MSAPVSLSPPPLDAPPSLAPANVRVKTAGPAFDHPRTSHSNPVRPS